VRFIGDSGMEVLRGDSEEMVQTPLGNCSINPPYSWRYTVMWTETSTSNGRNVQNLVPNDRW
jgi:hypothetical protein